MKNFLSGAGLGLALLAAATAPAIASGGSPAGKEAGSKEAIALSDPSRPATVRAASIHGSISVEGYGGKEVVVESIFNDDDDSGKQVPSGAEGMHRIPNHARGLTLHEANNVVTVDSTPWGGGSSRELHILVPVHSSLHLSCINDCALRVRGVEGDLELANVNGSIEARDVSGSVVAHTTNGKVKVALRSASPDKPMAFSTLNGDIDVTFPAGIRANVRLQSENGDIYSDFEIAGAVTTGGAINGGGGRHHKNEEEIRGTINGGGPEFLFKTFNGDVLIHRSKG